MVMSVLLKFLYPPPSSLFITAMSVMSFTSLANAGYMETKGKHMQYSKFLNVGSVKKPKEGKKEEGEEVAKLSSRNGMLVLYVPAFLVGLASFAIFPDQDLRFLLLRSALTIHFFKRVLEVLFVHKFSGFMELEAVIVITLSYSISTATMIYTQLLSKELPEPVVDLKYVGTALFLTGIAGNFYHHYLLSNLRKKGDKEYKIPKGGLFDLVICPHYLFEILGFFGISCIAQTVYPLAFTLGTTIYLMGRSYATREWYISKFGDKFPKDVKALIPYLF